MNNWFNIKRFWLVVQHEFANARIELAILATVLLLGYAMPYVNEYNKWIPAVYSVGFFIYEWVLASRVFVNMRSGTQCISYLTMPASNAEKFYARLLLYWLLPTAIFFFPYPNSGIHTDIYVAHIILSLLIVEASLAVLFGTIFRRFGFLALILVEAAIVNGISAYFATHPRAFSNFDFSFVAWVMEYVGPDLEHIGKLTFWVTAVPTVLNIGLARIIFSRKRLRRPVVNTEI